MEHLFMNCHGEITMFAMWASSLPFVGIYIRSFLEKKDV